MTSHLYNRLKKLCHTLLALSALWLSAPSALAEETQLTLTPIGRILADGALFWGNSELVDGVALPDIRVGLRAAYGQWSAKVEICYADNKVLMKDVFMQYNFNANNLVRVGNFIHPFGLQSVTNRSMKESFEEPSSNEVFDYRRMIGVMYLRNTPCYLSTYDAHTEQKSNSMRADQMGHTGIGFTTRHVWRPMHEQGHIVQVGISGAYDTPTYHQDPELNHSSFVFKANWPTRVSTVQALDAVVTDARHCWRYTPELLLAYDRWALMAQYYQAVVNRRNGSHSYSATGGYGELRTLLRGDSYGYLSAQGTLATPTAKSLEVVLGYNYVDTNDARAKVWGGNLRDASLTLNYYINRYMIARLRYAYTDVRHPGSRQHLNALQMRMQIIF